MKKAFFSCCLLILCFTLTSSGIHKFYISIYQIDYVPEKKVFHITSRIFIDDLNNALEKKYGRIFHLGDKQESAQDVTQMKQYINSHLKLTVNGKKMVLDLRTKEMENNVLICYFITNQVPKVKTISITNTILFDFEAEQQNIIQTKIYDVKNSLLLSTDNPKGSIQIK